MHKFYVDLLFCLFVLSLCLNGIADAQIRPSPYELVEIFRIGHEADGDTIFFRNHEFMEITVDNTGSIFVGGWNESPVMGFSNQGNFIGLVVSKGEGPGEFKRSDSITIGLGGKIYVFDTDLYRLSAFESGTFQYSHSLSTFNPLE
ncbi:MAG: 6-bladed beta-propeller [Bacteroidetes bacterium]|nr:6-bladed beta-propeller [Bacteroidota bacterium]